MSKIDWRKIAEMNGLTPSEFTLEITSTCIALLSMRLDENPESDTVNVSQGGYVLTLSKEKKPWERSFAEVMQLLEKDNER
jgi:hypothetical protein